MQTKTLLAIECSSELCSLALQHQVAGQTTVTYRSALAPREHAYLVLPFAQELLAEHALGFSDLQGIAFGQGPGAFTGLRVAAAMAQGLALAHDLPLFASCSLGVLARQLESKQLDSKQLNSMETINIIPVLDARMSELYWAVYQRKGDVFNCLKTASLSSAEDLMEALSTLNLSQPSYFIGPGCRHLIPFLNEKNCLNISTIDKSAECFPLAHDLLISVNDELSKNCNNSEPVETNDLPFPVYVRNDVAAKSKKPLV